MGGWHIRGVRSFREARRPQKGQVGKKLPVAVVMGVSDGGCDEQVLGNIEAA